MADKESKIVVTKNAAGQLAVKSCGVLVFRKAAAGYEFLLMKHPNRYDLPKGHNEIGETESQTALRELQEETGLLGSQVRVHPSFQFSEVYHPRYKRFGNQTVEKTIVVFAGFISDASRTVVPTEHKGYVWLPWNPPHSLQRNTIDPLLAEVAKFGLDKIVS